MKISTEHCTNNIHIALGFDSFYAVHIYAMLTSIFYNNKANNITFHAIAPNISIKENIEITEFINKNNSNIIFYKIDEDVLRINVDLPHGSYFTIATFYKWFFPSLVSPDIKMLLYLDPDIIVTGDLAELYNINTGDAPIAAVVDPVIGVREDLGIKQKGEYFNAGVMLINIKNWKLQNITEKAFRFVKNYPDNLIYLDQDALNATLFNNWLKIDKKYNFASFDVELQVPVKELIKDIIIVHFTSAKKPWNFLTRNKLRFLYHRYLKLSPKSNEKKYTDFKWDIKSIWAFTRIRIKEFYFDHKFYKIFPIKKWMISSPDY